MMLNEKCPTLFFRKLLNDDYTSNENFDSNLTYFCWFSDAKKNRMQDFLSHRPTDTVLRIKQNFIFSFTCPLIEINCN